MTETDIKNLIVQYHEEVENNPALTLEKFCAVHSCIDVIDELRIRINRMNKVFPGGNSMKNSVIANRYKLIEKLGEGGMGEVWLAEQTEPVKRKVAVKLIKPGMDSKAVLARFDAERQALALMDHPNIAKVLDGGLHETRPYFVMELVQGKIITNYCDEKKLTLEERLRLFIPVCQAIQHAHQKGIIHRDIKPSNVLVALSDDKPLVKVIDFGVAKATGGTLTEQSYITGFGSVVGTAQYMSPEQATLDNFDIDTRSDVYSLGVLLYELLAGSPPFSNKELETKGLLEVLRMVREDEPLRPSDKLSTANSLLNLSDKRRTEPKRLTSQLRNELDWVVMKALEKDRTRRYETASNFAADVLRYLDGEPVTAHPPSVVYRIRKNIRRNKAQVIAAGLVLATLLIGLSGTSYGLLKARSAESSALAAKSHAEEVAKAEQEARRLAEKRAQFLVEIAQHLTAAFKVKDPSALQTIRTGLLKFAEQLEDSDIANPLEIATLQIIVANALRNSGEEDTCIKLLESAVETRTKLLGKAAPMAVRARIDLALAFDESAEAWKPGMFTKGGFEGNYRTVREHYKKQISLLEQVRQLQQIEMKLPSNDPDRAEVNGHLALAYYKNNEKEKAFSLFQEAAESCESCGFKNSSADEILVNYTAVLVDNERYGEAVLWQKKLIKALKTGVPWKGTGTATTIELTNRYLQEVSYLGLIRWLQCKADLVLTGQEYLVMSRRGKPEESWAMYDLLVRISKSLGKKVSNNLQMPQKELIEDIEMILSLVFQRLCDWNGGLGSNINGRMPGLGDMPESVEDIAAKIRECGEELIRMHVLKNGQNQGDMRTALEVQVRKVLAKKQQPATKPARVP